MVMRRAVLIFVKYPEPGRVKTRLAATVGAERAAEIYRSMVREVLAGLPDDAAAIACFDPAERRAEIERWLDEIHPGKALHFLAQAEGDLGVRLERAFAAAFALGFEQVAAIGTDCVEIDDAIFRETWTALETRDVVLGPSEDGGYYVIALAAPCVSLFEKIPWSTERVLAETQARAADANLRVHLLPVRLDVDTEEDWRRARQHLELPRDNSPS